jgi:prepilin-type N-terminal cleavage/methylation domain-containing protein
VKTDRKQETKKVVKNMKSDSGFSLLEMMVTIGIVAIVGTVVVPSFIGKMPGKRLESAAGDVSAAIRAARLTAVKENTPAVVQLDVDTESYSVTVPGRAVKRGEMPAGVDLKSVFLSQQTTPVVDGLVTFDSRGFPTPPVDVVLQDTRGATRTIEVNLTGSSRIVRD